MIFFDIEATSLDADIGMLIAVGMLLPDGEMKILFVDNPEKEAEVIERSVEILRKHKEEPLMIWYSGFDIPFLVSRAIKHGLDVSEIYDFKVIDLCKLVQENLKFASNKLDEVSKFFGIKKNLSVTGKNVQRLYLQAMNGDEKSKEEIIKHCEDDLKALQEIYKKLEKYVEKWLSFN